MEKPLETTWVGLKVVWGRASGNHQGGANSGSQVDAVLRYGTCLPALWLCGGRVQKIVYGFWQHLCLGESLPALAPMLDKLVPPQLSLMPFNLLPSRWSSEGVSLCKSVWSLKRNCLGLQKFLSSTASIPAGFYSQKLWRRISLALELWAGGLV